MIQEPKDPNYLRHCGRALLLSIMLVFGLLAANAQTDTLTNPNQPSKVIAVEQTDTFTKADPILEAESVTKPDSTVKKLTVTDKVIRWYNHHLNYGTVTLLMAVESSFIPFPSEVIVPPAAYQACNADNPALYKTHSKILNILFVVLFATLGALIGALINYYLAVILGRPIIYWFADSKVGHILMLNGEKIKKAENYFIENGNSSTFIGRLIPGIRQLISIPAGLAKMNIFKFMLYTSLGAGAWNIILAFLGYLAHGQQDLINKYNEELKIIMWVVFALFIAYLIYKGVKSSKKKKKGKDKVVEPEKIDSPKQ